MSRMAKLDRLLMLVHALAGNPEGLSLDDMAALTEVNRRTAERMRNIIMMHFDLEPLQDGRNKRWRISGRLGRMFTKPTPEEMATLQAEVEALRASQQVAKADILAGLLAKIQGALDQAARNRAAPDVEALAMAQRVFVPAGPGVPVPPATFAAIQQAIMAGCQIEFDYLAEGKVAAGWRRVIPYGLVHGPINYLIGKLPDRDIAPALYRLDRMSGVRGTDIPGSIPDEFDLDAWMAESFGIWREATHSVRLKILPAASERGLHWRFHPRQVLTQCEDKSLVVEFEAGGIRELAEHLCTWAGDVIVEQPAELREELAAIARKILDAYGDVAA